ncbi:MAG: hypothetical protein R2751_00285 [Bacteroidales bacterium]
MALAFVDHVVIFEEDTPWGSSSLWNPMTIAWDYRVEDIVGYM